MEVGGYRLDCSVGEIILLALALRLYDGDGVLLRVILVAP
jgi:hypothetical protein